MAVHALAVLAQDPDGYQQTFKVAEPGTEQSEAKDQSRFEQQGQRILARHRPSACVVNHQRTANRAAQKCQHRDYPIDDQSQVPERQVVGQRRDNAGEVRSVGLHREKAAGNP